MVDGKDFLYNLDFVIFFLYNFELRFLLNKFLSSWSS